MTIDDDVTLETLVKSCGVTMFYPDQNDDVCDANVNVSWLPRVPEWIGDDRRRETPLVTGGGGVVEWS